MVKNAQRDQADSVVEMEESAAELPDVDTSLPISKRPLCGEDVGQFGTQFNLQKSDVVYVLAFTNPIMMQHVAVSPKPLDFSLEVLMRLYLKRPGPAPWRKYSPSEGLNLIYGDVLKLFKGTKHETAAIKYCQRRFVQCFGRHPTTSYRWFKSVESSSAKHEVSRVLAKLSEEGEAGDHKAKRDLLEDIARMTYRVRGASALEDALPTKASPPPPRRRGPVPGSKRTKRVPEVRSEAQAPRTEHVAVKTSRTATASASSTEQPSLKTKLKRFMEENGATSDDVKSLVSGVANSKAAQTATTKVKSKSHVGASIRK